MVSAEKFAKLQRLFFQKVTSGCNVSTVDLKFIETSSESALTKFTGDGKRTVKKSVNLKCFYKRNISDKDREKMGVNQEVTSIVYISPLDLKAKTGSMSFDDDITKSYSGIMVEFIGKLYQIESIIDLEPMFDGKEWVCLAYQINLKNSDRVAIN